MSDFLVEYPSEVPLVSASALVRIVRSGRWATERAAFAQHAWIVQGYLQGRILGRGSSPHVVGDVEAEILDDQEATESLLALIEFRPDAVAAASIPWGALLFWILRRLLEAVSE